MAAAAVGTRSPVIPVPRTAADDGPGAGPDSEPRPATGSAAGYQRVLHQLVRRELRMLAELAGWAPAAEAPRTAVLTGHAGLVGRVLLHHHAVEREAVWPALLGAVPAEAVDEVRAAVDDATARCARIDQMLRDVATAGRQWAVAGTVAARNAFAGACRDLADTVDAQTADEERRLLPLVAEHLRPGEWAAIARSSRCRLSGREQMLVLGLALEDASATDRARLLGGLPRATRVTWRISGARSYRSAVVRLRGAPPAA
jgi:hypothetical protein